MRFFFSFQLSWLTKCFPQHVYIIVFSKLFVYLVIISRDHNPLCVLIFSYSIPPRFFFSLWVFLHEHSRFTGQQGKGEAISLTTTSNCLADTYKLARQLLQEVHLCKWLPAGLELETFGFRVQDTNHQGTHSQNFIIRITSVLMAVPGKH